MPDVFNTKHPLPVKQFPREINSQSVEVGYFRVKTVWVQLTNPRDQLSHQIGLDSIAVSLFVYDILVELTNTVSDGKIQITILILRQGALSRHVAYRVTYTIERGSF